MSPSSFAAAMHEMREGSSCKACINPHFPMVAIAIGLIASSDFFGDGVMDASGLVIRCWTVLGVCSCYMFLYVTVGYEMILPTVFGTYARRSFWRSSHKSRPSGNLPKTMEND